jgi:hypothetical protein
MADNGVQIDFSAPASLRKWPSLNSERLTGADFELETVTA